MGRRGLGLCASDDRQGLLCRSKKRTETRGNRTQRRVRLHEIVENQGAFHPHALLSPHPLSSSLTSDDKRIGGSAWRAAPVGKVPNPGL